MTTRVTRAEVDGLIDTLIGLALRFEEIRDELPYESPAYWKAHDRATELHVQAERLMPGGGFWTSPREGF